jgi:hypothetical protein
MSRPQISLAGARKEIENINNVLQGKCGPSYKLELLQYRHRDPDAAVYDDATSNEYDVILCLYHENKCVSSITGRYNKPTNSMELLSKTNEKYEGLRYNLYLRTVFMYLMFFVRPRIDQIYSHSTNPISTYAMYKHYHANNQDLQEYVEHYNLTPETFALSDAINFHAYFGEKNKQTQESAQQELDDMLEDCREMYNVDCGVEDLGWETKEEAIEFIKTTMNLKAITLALDLGHSGVKDFLLNKLLNIDVKCRTTHRLAAGGTKSRHTKSRNTKSRNNKSRRNKKQRW